MPQRTCCVSSCSSAQIDGSVLHAFPNPVVHEERFNIWVKNAGLVGEDNDYIFKNRRICQKHFETIYHYPKNRLSALAVPTLHVPGPLDSVCHTMELLGVTNSLLPSSSTAGGYTGLLHSELKAIPVNEPSPSTSSYFDAGNKTKSMPADFPPRSKKPSVRNKVLLKPLSKTEMELQSMVQKTQSELNRCKKAKLGLAEKLKVLKKCLVSEAYKTVMKELSPEAKIFFEMMVRESHKNPKGRRFTWDEKILALSLYKPSPKAYKILSKVCVLPKRTTLNKLMNKIFLLPGYNNIIFDNLKKRVARMRHSSHKLCTLIFDEMAIAANFSYDKHNDKIKGLCDDGTERSQKIADHVLVFMIRGVVKKYKQPIVFTFCKGTTSTLQLKSLIKTIILKLQETGLKVISTTCDQGATNLASLNMLIRETKEEYLRRQEEFKGGFFEIGGQKIYPIYDPPHLIKGIRNNLIQKNLEYTLNGKKRVAKWQHLVALYKKGPNYKGARFAPKLTARHVMPQLIPKMKVKFATQVFSRTVSIALGLSAETRRIPKECEDTADLLMFFDQLFDSVNGNFSEPKKGKIYRSAVKPHSPHQRLWKKSIPILKTMRFVGGRAVVPSISSWIKTIQSFQHIVLKLHSLGLKSLLLRQFNQDPLENFFGAIRAHGHGNIMPSCAAFEASYKALLLNNMVSSQSLGANCEEDDSFCLQNLKFFLSENVTRPMSKSIEINMEHLELNLPNVDDLLKSDDPLDVEKCGAAAYCSGWLLNYLFKNVSKNCKDCKQCLEGDSEETFSRYIKLKKYSEKSILHYPSKELLEFFIQTEYVTIKILQSHCHLEDIALYIAMVTTSLISTNFIDCVQHKESLVDILIKKSIQFFIFDWCKEINNILTGKNITFDENDPIKQMAYEHNIKNKLKKRQRQTGESVNV